MMARTGSGWQYILADLSLILFMVTAAALASTEDAPAAAQPPIAAKQVVSPQAEPLAVYRAGPGAPPLRVWLQDQASDARQQLTIVAQYAPGTQADALAQAEALAREAGEAGAAARIVIEPGEGGTTAALAFDTPASDPSDKRQQSMARNLQVAARIP